MNTPQLTPYTRFVRELSKTYSDGNYFVDLYQIESLLEISLRDAGMNGANVTFSQLREIWERDCESVLFNQLQAA
jgi:hypothetical protein